jgi:hypothetical protein
MLCDVWCGVICGVICGVMCGVICGVMCGAMCGVICGVICGVMCGVSCGVTCSASHSVRFNICCHNRTWSGRHRMEQTKEQDSKDRAKRGVTYNTSYTVCSVI